MSSQPTENGDALINHRMPSVILCGYERGGTTLLSQIFRENGYVGGFEVGALMCETPAHFLSYKPYIDMLRPGWKLGNRIEMKDLCSGSFEDFYHKLVSTAFPKAIKKKAFDKTPIYMRKLGTVLHRAPFVKKAVVITRDPRAVFTSWARRACPEGAPVSRVEREVQNRMKQYAERYLDYFYGAIAHEHNPRVLFIAFEQLCLSQSNSLKQLGIFCRGRPFRLKELNHKFKNIQGKSISIKNVLEFEGYLSNETQAAILELTHEAAAFFCDTSLQIRYGDRWRELNSAVDEILDREALDELSYQIDGVYLEPRTYLLRNRDVLQSGMSPVSHFKQYGLAEGRSGA